jgi:hypothetical protein
VKPHLFKMAGVWFVSGGEQIVVDPDFRVICRCAVLVHEGRA